MPGSARYGVGLIGCGNIGVSRHLPAWLERPAGFRLIAIADPTPARLEVGRAAAGLQPRDAHLAVEDLLDRDDIHVVDVCVPPRLRRDIVIAAARAGKHVLAEKPLATVPADAAAMIAAADSSGVKLGVVHNYLFFPEIARARQVIASGRIGRVEVAILNYLGAMDHPGAAAYQPTWRHDPGQSGGGVLMDLLHVVYLAEALLGEPIERVSAYVTARNRNSGVEDLALCRFEAADSVAIVNVGWGVGPGGIEISGTTGRLAIRYEGGGTSPFAPFEELVIVDERGSRSVDVPPDNGFLERAIVDFAESIAGDRTPIAPGEQGLHILEATVGAYKSAATGRTITLPLDRADPMFQRGVGGVMELDIPAWSPIRSNGIFGVRATSPEATPTPDEWPRHDTTVVN
ncbi:MAG: Gfo/Idh/MocA family protein [Actinomycetota bacterium]